MKEEKKYELIERYLSKEMDVQERMEFEQQLSNNADLKNEMILHQQIAETVGGEEIHDFRNALKNIDKTWERPSEKPENGKVFRLNFKRVLAVAASIALLIFVWQLYSVETSFSLYLAHHEPYQMILNQRSNSDNSFDVELLNSAIQQYSAGQFIEAAQSFEKLYEHEPENIAYQFYQAVSISENSSTEAIPVFIEILNKPDHLFIEQSRWYLGLAYLENKEIEKAISTFEEIKKGEYKFEEARSILKEIVE